jgi:fatty-acyl-CoA synthase
MANLWTLAQVFRRSAREHPVPVNPRLKYHELTYQPRHAEVSAACAAEQYDGIDFLQYFEDVITELPDRQYLVTVGEEELWYDDRIFRLEDLVSSGEGRRYPETLSAGDDSDLALLYTSGTMGKPKGVRLSALRSLEAERISARRRADGVPPVDAGCPV